MVGINEVQSYFMQLPPVVTLLYLCWENKAPATGHPHVNAGRNHHGVGDPWRAHPWFGWAWVGHGKSMATQFSKI